MLLGPIANEPLVRVTLGPACAVIHVGDHKGVPQFVEQVKQHRGIAPAARPHHELCSQRNIACAELAALLGAGRSWLQTISKGFGFEQALVVLRLGLGKQGDGAPKSGVHVLFPRGASRFE